MNQHQNRFTPDDFGNETTGPMFQGLRHDPEQSWFMAHGRSFHPKAQPWINQEPLAYVDGMNVYTAFGCNPIKRKGRAERGRR
jgi:RHS repeat-associated protein